MGIQNGLNAVGFGVQDDLNRSLYSPSIPFNTPSSATEGSITAAAVSSTSPITDDCPNIASGYESTLDSSTLHPEPESESCIGVSSGNAGQALKSSTRETLSPSEGTDWTGDTD
ncbi:hypothetical protein B0H12DRAFT_202689 [Mycena haematopus]|nr:hypothetical protein B0H12DRAFT_202689 [Mycena haematopus]